jgi:hypothetical protein
MVSKQISYRFWVLSTPCLLRVRYDVVLASCQYLLEREVFLHARAVGCLFMCKEILKFNLLSQADLTRKFPFFNGRLALGYPSSPSALFPSGIVSAGEIQWILNLCRALCVVKALIAIGKFLC